MSCAETQDIIRTKLPRDFSRAERGALLLHIASCDQCMFFDKQHAEVRRAEIGDAAYQQLLEEEQKLIDKDKVDPEFPAQAIADALRARRNDS